MVVVVGRSCACGCLCGERAEVCAQKAVCSRGPQHARTKRAHNSQLGVARRQHTALMLWAYSAPAGGAEGRPSGKRDGVPALEGHHGVAAPRPEIGVLVEPQLVC